MKWIIRAVMHFLKIDPLSDKKTQKPITHITRPSITSQKPYIIKPISIPILFFPRNQMSRYRLPYSFNNNIR